MWRVVRLREWSGHHIVLFDPLGRDYFVDNVFSKIDVFDYKVQDAAHDDSDDVLDA